MHPEPTGSGTLLSFAAFLYPKRKISEVDFSWVEPLNPTIWNLFDICWLSDLILQTNR